MASHFEDEILELLEETEDDERWCKETKNGVNILEKMIRTYTCTRMTRRWPVSLFYNMIDVSAVNAYIVWQQLHGKNYWIFSKKKRRKFLIRLGNELAGISMQTRRAN